MGAAVSYCSKSHVLGRNMMIHVTNNSTESDDDNAFASSLTKDPPSPPTCHIVPFEPTCMLPGSPTVGRTLYGQQISATGLGRQGSYYRFHVSILTDHRSH
eukprot:GILI01025244.1.p1 GENE.GILI01025244.1~~GILI01025244.1.p1  ORF type:complete len:101 (+),score=6.20 GILI01025244.1:267-569(+)